MLYHVCSREDPGDVLSEMLTKYMNIYCTHEIHIIHGTEHGPSLNWPLLHPWSSLEPLTSQAKYWPSSSVYYIIDQRYWPSSLRPHWPLGK